MTNYHDIDFSPLNALAEGEVVTHSRVRDIRLPSGKVLALITLDNGRDHNRPNTLGPTTLTELGATLDGLKARAAAGEIQAVGITGKQYILAAGADLSDISKLGSKDNARLIAQLGHHVFGKISDLGVPSFAFVNGLALGGGLEIALNSSYRTVDSSAAAVALPEVFLGIIPGWGGAIALGHPLAASGVRLMIQLAAQFAERPDVRYGLTAMCVGLGQGGSVIWENPNYDGKKK